MAALPFLLFALGSCLQERVAVDRPAPRGLAVRVVDERGAPVARARVVVVEPLTDGKRFDDEPQVELLRRGTPWWTGDDGVAVVRVAAAEVSVVASSEDGARWGLANVRARGGRPLELPIRLEGELPIELVDAAGNPAAGVELRLEASVHGVPFAHSIDLAPSLLSFPLRSDHAGRAAVGASDRFALAALAGSDDTTWRDAWLRVVAPTLGAVAERAGAADGADALRLTLPEAGRVELELRDRVGKLAAVDVVGETKIERSDGGHRMAGGHAAYSSDGPSWSRACRVRFIAGRATLPLVARAARIEVEASHGVRRWHAGPDPVVEGADGVFRMALREEPPRPATRLRIVDEAGVPITACPVEVRASYAAGPITKFVTTSGFDGGLVLLHEKLHNDRDPHRRLPDFLEQVALLVDDEPESLRVAELPKERFLSRGDLGDVVLDRRARRKAVAGRVVDPSGVPLAGISVTAELPGWSALEFGRVKVTGPDGAFAFHGEFEGRGVVRLLLREPEFGTNWEYEIEIGMLDALLELRRFGVLCGTVLLDPGVSPSDIQVSACWRADPAPRSINCSGSAHAFPWQGRARFELGALRPGRYDVELAHRGALGDEPLATLRDVEVPIAAFARDARLDAIDLRGALAITTFRVVDAAGEPIERGEITFDEAAARREERQPDKARLEGGRCTIVAAASLSEATVRAPGFRTRRVRPKRGENVVDLAPALPYRVRISAQGLPDGEEWRFEVDPAREDDEPEQITIAPAADAIPRAALEAGAIAAPDEELLLLASAPGPARIDVHVMRRDPESRRWACVRCVTRKITLPDRRDAPTFEFALEEKELEKIRAAVRREEVLEQAEAQDDEDGR